MATFQQPVMPMHGVQQIMIPQQNSMYQTLGTFVILYALLRIGWSMLWTLNNEQMIGWLLAPVGFFIGFCRSSHSFKAQAKVGEEP